MSRCKQPGCDRDAVAVGYCMRHYKQARRGTLPPPGAPQVGDPDGYGRYGYLDGGADYVVCHECGRELQSLISHVYTAHGLRARAYKIKHGLPLGRALDSPSVSAARSKTARARLNSKGWEKFTERRDPTAASHARTEESFQRRGVQAQEAAERARKNIAGQTKPPIDKPCVVCLRQVRTANHLTCCDECRRVAAYRERGGGELAVRIIGMRDDGMTWAEIGAQLGVTGQAAGARVRAYRRHMVNVRRVVAREPRVRLEPYEVAP